MLVENLRFFKKFASIIKMKPYGIIIATAKIITFIR